MLEPCCPITATPLQTMLCDNGHPSPDPHTGTSGWKVVADPVSELRMSEASASLQNTCHTREDSVNSPPSESPIKEPLASLMSEAAPRSRASPCRGHWSESGFDSGNHPGSGAPLTPAEISRVPFHGVGSEIRANCRFDRFFLLAPLHLVAPSAKKRSPARPLRSPPHSQPTPR